MGRWLDALSPACTGCSAVTHTATAMSTVSAIRCAVTVGIQHLVVLVEAVTPLQCLRARY